MRIFVVLHVLFVSLILWPIAMLEAGETNNVWSVANMFILTWGSGLVLLGGIVRLMQWRGILLAESTIQDMRRKEHKGISDDLLFLRRMVLCGGVIPSILLASFLSDLSNIGLSAMQLIATYILPPILLYFPAAYWFKRQGNSSN